MTKANPKEREFCPKLAHDVEADACFIWRAGAGREDDCLGIEFLNLSQRDGVIAHHLALISKLADIAGQIENEAVVIIDQEDHFCFS